MLGYEYQKDIPFDTNPKDLKTAKSLTRTIAQLSNCKGLEHERYYENQGTLRSVCYKNDLKEGSYTWASYSIFSFSNKKEKSVIKEKLKLNKEMFKEGPFYIILENSFFGESKYNTPRSKSPHAYADFPGELIYLDSNH